MSGFGGFAQGLGQSATDISQAVNDREKEGIVRAHLAFQQRQQMEQVERNRIAAGRLNELERHNRETEALGTNRFTAMSDPDKKRDMAFRGIALAVGYPDAKSLDDIPEVLRPVVQAGVMSILTGKKGTTESTIADPNSTTGATKVIKSLTGDTLSSTPNVTSVGAQHDIKDRYPEQEKQLKMRFDEQEKLLGRRLTEEEKLQQRKLGHDEYMIGLHEASAMKLAQWHSSHPANTNTTLAGLAVLKTSLHGGEDALGNYVPGLDSSVDVLDNATSRYKLSALFHKIGADENPGFLLKLVPAYISDPANSAMFADLSTAEIHYVYQMQNAASAIGALRGVMGNPRSTEALMKRYMKELTDPMTVRSAADARYKLSQLDRDIHQAEVYLNTNEQQGLPPTGIQHTPTVMKPPPGATIIPWDAIPGVK